MARKITLIFFLFSYACLDILTQNLLKQPFPAENDARVKILEIIYNPYNNDLEFKCRFQNTTAATIRLSLDKDKIFLIQDGVYTPCKTTVGVSRSEVYVIGGKPEFFSIIFDAYLFQDNVPFRIEEKVYNGWNFAIPGIEIPNSLPEKRLDIAKLDSIALLDLGYQYYLGEEVPLSYDNALVFFKKSAIKGSPKAYTNVGIMYMGGMSDEEDPVAARPWFEKGAELGEGKSQYYLGEMYKTGNGTLRNKKKAEELFRQSANSGNADAQYELALICKEKNQLSEALSWFEKCAVENKDAQYELGLMYYYAKGTTKNTKKAAYWIRKAYENGNSEAKKVWESLELWNYE